MALWPIALLVACEVPRDPSLEETSARDAYVRAWCRLYTTEACVRDQQRTCDWEASFEDRTTCTNWLTFRVSQCPGANEMFLEHEAGVTECARQLQDFECGVDEFCVDGQPTFDVDACAPIAEFLSTRCE